MSSESQHNGRTLSPDELRERVEGTREQLGQSVEELAGRVDAKARMRERTTAITARTREKAARVARLAQDRTPEPVRRKAVSAGTRIGQGAAAVAGTVRSRTPAPVSEKAGQAARAARSRPGLLAVVAALLVVWAGTRRSGKRR
ncbi:DUF3618 domain-containing protein [Streptomyces sp. DH37]|uniref:DUF3618 domain-containing protein n=1 Tax=Streptomyces sp. DH37 TaxID=3040122 RepID=UPI00244212A9|nr:DUF3618 domain-containing protein [Streptomyces sp. DH37]MDG9703528.1 DUF3618 domain-containing protein [Streptomyces sp. DH37]